MKQLVCEMCNSNDLLKDGDYFICQHCGCKYTVEAAKKMMIEGTVDVSGSTVQIDNSSKNEKLYILARRAKEEGNSEDAEKYYKEVLIDNPNDWEALFYAEYYHACRCKVGEIALTANNVANNIKSTITLIDKTIDSNNRKAIFAEICEKIIRLGTNLYTSALKYGLPYMNDSNNSLYDKVHREVGTMMHNIMEMYRVLAESLMSEGDKEDAVLLYKQMVEKNEYYPSRVVIFYEDIQKYISIIKDVDPNYSEPVRKSKGGCYVATAVYGSYDCPEVWTLRRYRDYDLAKTWYGRLFIKTYYAISPTIVKWFGDTEWFKNMWRGKLDRMVSNLKSKGYEDTPYEDKDWK